MGHTTFGDFSNSLLKTPRAELLTVLDGMLQIDPEVRFMAVTALNVLRQMYDLGYFNTLASDGGKSPSVFSHSSRATCKCLFPQFLAAGTTRG